MMAFDNVGIYMATWDPTEANQASSATHERCEVEAVHSQGQAQSVIDSRNGLGSVLSWPGGSRGTCAGPRLTRPLRRTFRGETSQVPLVRDFIRRYLTGWACPADAVQDTLLCATELAANAVRHSRSGLPGGCFGVQTDIRSGASVQVAVADAGGPWLSRETGDDDAEGGRGLQVVAALSAEMGIIGNESGRTVWFRCPWKSRGDGDFPVPPPRLSCAEEGLGFGA
jgi:anti-sigma regulatory factor (Ser/Thr protein kinase)